MKWEGTCGIADPKLMELGEKFIRAKSGLFFVWGHSYELDQFNLWDRLEEFCRFMSRREDIIYATNREVYEALNKK